MAAMAQRKTRGEAGPSPSRLWLDALERTARLDEDPTRTLPLVLEAVAGTRGDAPALIFDDTVWSYAGLLDRCRRYSRWGFGLGLGAGDVVALMMPNRPDYLAAWLGLTRLGCTVALLNTNLRGEALAHGLRVADPRLAIVDVSLRPALAEAAGQLDAPLAIWRAGDDTGGALGHDLDAALAATDPAPLSPDEAPLPALGDRALLIYTSGTTGLPKAANVSHRRILTWSLWFSGLMQAGPADRIYDCLPLYHSVGGVVAPGALLASGGTVVLAEKFSARRFWDDVVRHDCTIVQYIGELCRYLVAAPAVPAERMHHVRLFCGNGLREDVWRALQERFGIPRILEFYAATEGNFSLFNVEGRPGAIGRIPPFLAHRFPAVIVRHDADSGEPARDAEGRCIRCAVDEPGEALGLVSDGTRRPGSAFEGYTSAAESERKILRDVFRPGDAWFRTGDLMTIDAQGFYSFVDRVGDTFRWKGENVSTGEVEAALHACPGVVQAVVYGVAVPGAEGRAGMAMLVPGPGFDPDRLFAALESRLPAYARPLILRLAERLAVTETFKPKKAALAREGFDPARIADRLLLVDPRGRTYRPLDAALHAAVLDGGWRL